MKTASTVILFVAWAGAAAAADVARAPAGADAQSMLGWDNGTPGTTWTSSAWAGNDFSIATLATYNYIQSCRMYYWPNWPNGAWDGGAVRKSAEDGRRP